MVDNPTPGGKINIGGVKVTKPVAFIVGGSLLVGGVLYYRHSQANKAAAASVAQAGGTTIDPATGYGYGTPEDAAALSAQSGYSSASGIGSGYGYTNYGGGYGSSAFGSGTPGSFANNAEWAQFVTAYLVNNEGADAPTVAAAIGEYLTGKPIDSDKLTVVESAIAIGGYPPVSGPNGDPPNYITGTTTPPPTPTNGTCPSGYAFSATQTGTTGEIAATGGSGFCVPNAVTPPPAPAYIIGTVHSTTTGESGKVDSSDGGNTWNYIGAQAKPGQPQTQNGNVTSSLGTINVKSTDMGYHWRKI